MAISLTPAARERVAQFMQRDPSAQALRFGVRRTGCSGWAYVVDMASQTDPDDHVFQTDGLRVIVDAKSLPLVDGTEIDFSRQGLNNTFVFRNPNVTGECGCGESFAVSAPG